MNQFSRSLYIRFRFKLDILYNFENNIEENFSFIAQYPEFWMRSLCISCSSRFSLEKPQPGLHA